MKPLNQHIIERLKVSNSTYFDLEELFNEIEIWMKGRDTDMTHVPMYFTKKYKRCTERKFYKFLPIIELTPENSMVTHPSTGHLCSFLYFDDHIKLKYYKPSDFSDPIYVKLKSKDDLSLFIDDDLLKEITETIREVNERDSK